MVGDVDIVDKGARETYGYIQTSIQTYVIYGHTYHTHTRIRWCMLKYIDTYINMYVCRYLHIYIQTYVDTYT